MNKKKKRPQLLFPSLSNTVTKGNSSSSSSSSKACSSRGELILKRTKEAVEAEGTTSTTTRRRISFSVATANSQYQKAPSTSKGSKSPRKSRLEVLGERYYPKSAADADADATRRTLFDVKSEPSLKLNCFGDSICTFSAADQWPPTSNDAADVGSPIFELWKKEEDEEEEEEDKCRGNEEPASVQLFTPNEEHSSAPTNKNQKIEQEDDENEEEEEENEEYVWPPLNKLTSSSPLSSWGDTLQSLTGVSRKRKRRPATTNKVPGSLTVSALYLLFLTACFLLLCCVCWWCYPLPIATPPHSECIMSLSLSLLILIATTLA